jgi:hypothetical protein
MMRRDTLSKTESNLSSFLRRPSLSCSGAFWSFRGHSADVAIVGRATRLGPILMTVLRVHLWRGAIGRGDGSPKRETSSSYGVGEPRFKAFGERPRQSPTAGWSILYRLRSADGRTLALIEPSSQADLAFNPTCRSEPIWVSVTSHRNTSGERKPHGITCNAEG